MALAIVDAPKVAWERVAHPLRSFDLFRAVLKIHLVVVALVIRRKAVCVCVCVWMCIFKCTYEYEYLCIYIRTCACLCIYLTMLKTIAVYESCS